MGDMADFINDEWGDDLFEGGAETFCAHCDEDELHWAKNEKGKWVLVDANGALHTCGVTVVLEED